MFKKFFIVILTLPFIFILNYNSVNALEHPLMNEDNEESENFVAELEEKKDLPKEEFISEISPFVTFNIGHTSLGVNKYIKSQYAFNISNGDKIKIKNVTWSPAGQKIQLGFVDANNGDRYWTTDFTGGSKVGGTFSLGGPSGRYYVAIRTSPTNTQSINVDGLFEY